MPLAVARPVVMSARIAMRGTVVGPLATEVTRGPTRQVCRDASSVTTHRGQ